MLLLKLLLVLCLLSLPCLAVGFIVEIEANSNKCVAEFYDPNTLVVARYIPIETTANHEDMKIDIRIVDPENKEVYSKNEINAVVKSAFTTKMEGDYQFCFSVRTVEGKEPSNDWVRLVEVSITHGVDAKDYSALISTEHLTSVEVEMRKMEDAVNGILSELQYMKKREVRMRETNESTDKRIMYFGLFSILVMIALGGWQLYHLEKFFKARKLL